VNRQLNSGATAGCLYGISIATVTGLLLFINGAIVLVFVRALVQSETSLLSRPDVAQLLLLSVPVVMVVFQWKMIDYVRGRFNRHSS